MKPTSLLAILTCMAVLGLAADAHAQTVNTLYNFTGGSDGAHPYAGLVLDSTGNLYGSTQKDGPHGTGTVFKLTPAGKETTLLGFGYAPSGAFPPAALVFRSSGPQIAIIDKGNRVTFRKVTIARDDGTTVSIDSGISLGDKIALNISSQITEGETVEPHEFTDGVIHAPAQKK